MKSLKDTTDDLSPAAKRECPNCHVRVRVGSKFCYNCRQKLDDETTTSGPLSSAVTNKATIPLPASPDSAPADTPSAPQEASPPPLGPVAAVLARQQTTRPLAELYFDLGVALIRLQEYTKAAEVMQNAVDAQGTTSELGNILFCLAYTYEQGGRSDDAFRSYLDALLHVPDQIETVMPRLHELLSPQIALLQRKWIVNEWLPRIKNSTNAPLALMHIALFVGRVHLYTAHYVKAQQYFGEATQIDADTAGVIASEFLTFNKLPPALANYEHDGNMSYLLARLYHAIGIAELALQHLNHALKCGLTEIQEPSSVLTEAYQLKAELLEQEASRRHDGNQEQIALALYEAAKEPHSQGKYLLSITLLKRAIALNSQYVHSYWSLAESLREYSLENMTSAKELLEESLSIWNQGYQLQPVDADTSLAYITRALINEQFAQYSKEQVQLLSWEAVAYMERCVLYPADAITYALLGRCYRNAGINTNALQATETAMILDPTEPTVLGERVMALASVSNYAEAETIVDQFLAIVPADMNMDILGEKADIAFNLGRYQEGTVLFSTLIGSFPNEVWYHSRRARCYLWQGEHNLAMQDYRWVWEHNDPSNHINQIYYGWAAYRLGEIDAALEIFQAIPSMSIGDTGDLQSCIGQCYLSQGKFELAEELLGRSVELSTNHRQLDDILKDLQELLQFFPSQLTDGRPYEIIERIKEKIDRRKAELEQLPTAEDELRAILAQSELTEKTNGWSWIAAQAGLARLHSEINEWIEVAKIYLLLREKEGERFPDIRSIQNVVDPLQNVVDYYFRTEISDEQLDEIFDLMEPLFNFLTDDLPRQARESGQLGYIYFVTDDPEAMNFFTESIQLYRASGYPNAGAALGDACSPMLRDGVHYWALDDAWKTLAEKPETDEQLRNDLAEARTSLAAFLDYKYQLAELEPEETQALLIAFSITNRLLPEDGQPNWDPITTYLKQSRQQLHDEMGIYLPDISISYTDVGEETDYTVSLNDVPLLAGNIQLGMRYSPISPTDLQAAGVPPAALVAMPHPLTGAPSCWVAPNAWEYMSNQNLELWPDELFYMTYSFEAVMRTHLADVMGIDEVQQLLSEWKQNEVVAPLLTSALPDERTQFHFARILRALVQEQVPLTDMASILTAVQGPDLSDGNLSSAVRSVRLALKRQLPGNTLTAQRLELSHEWEDRLASALRQGKHTITFNISPEEKLGFLSMVNDWVQAHTRNWNMVLVTRDAELRPFIRLLVEEEFPRLMVLSQEELLSPNEMQGAVDGVHAERTKGIDANA